MFTTLARFDPVYVSHFKCDKQRISDYPNLSGYVRELYQWPGVADTVNITNPQLGTNPSTIKRITPMSLAPRWTVSGGGPKETIGDAGRGKVDVPFDFQLTPSQAAAIDDKVEDTC